MIKEHIGTIIGCYKGELRQSMRIEPPFPLFRLNTQFSKALNTLI